MSLAIDVVDELIRETATAVSQAAVSLDPKFGVENAIGTRLEILKEVKNAIMVAEMKRLEGKPEVGSPEYNALVRAARI